MLQPEVGTISDIVGGSAHPGFMRQTVEGAAGVLTRSRPLRGRPRPERLHVPAESFLPERVAAAFLDAVRKIL